MKNVARIIGAAFFLLVMWTAIQAVSLVSTLQTVQREYGSSLTSRTVLTNSTAELKKLKAADELLAKASAAAGDPTMVLASHIPFAGFNLDVVRHTAVSMHAVSSNLVELATLTTSIHPIGAGDLNLEPRLVRSMADSIDALEGNVRALTQQTARYVKSKDLTSELRSKLERLLGNLKPLIGPLDGINRYATVLEAVAGSDKSTSWLVVAQNLAELRGTGGMVGNFSVLEAGAGKFTISKTGSDVDIAQAGGARTSKLASQVVDAFGADPKVWQDLNVSPDFPTAARSFARTWRAVSGQKVAGVVAMDQHTIADLLALTGPVEVAGKTLDSENSSWYLAHQIYRDYPEVGAKNAFVAELTRRIFSQLISGDLRLTDFAKRLRTDQPQGSILAWSADRHQQQFLVNRGVSGAVDQSWGTSAWLAFNNAGGNKLDAFLRASVSEAVVGCKTEASSGLPGRRRAMTVTFNNDAPKRGLPDYVVAQTSWDRAQKLPLGTNRVLVSVLAPVGSLPVGFEVNGVPQLATQYVLRSHPVYQLIVLTSPGGSSSVKFTWDEPRIDYLGRPLAEHLDLRLPRMLNPVKVAKTPKTSGCE